MSARIALRLEPCGAVNGPYHAPAHLVAVARPVSQTSCRQARSLACSASRKDRKAAGKSGGGGGGGGGGGSDPRLDVIRDQRQQQLAASDVLAKLMQAEDPMAEAPQYVDSLDEQFFWTANTYLTMAKKEGEAEVVARLEAALKAAFEAKQATLRPEIQLLNGLLAAEGPEARAQVLASGNAAEALSMNERYFFGLLSRMIADVRRQPESEQRDDLLAKLEGIERDAEASAAAAPSSS